MFPIFYTWTGVPLCSTPSGEKYVEPVEKPLWKNFTGCDEKNGFKYRPQLTIYNRGMGKPLKTW